LLVYFREAETVWDDPLLEFDLSFRKQAPHLLWLDTRPSRSYDDAVESIPPLPYFMID